MTGHSYPGPVTLDSIFNFRDLGGCRTQNGKTIAWRRLFRSGELNHMTVSDFDTLKSELGMTSVIDLRSKLEIKKDGLGLLADSHIHYHNISLISDGGDRKANEQRYKDFNDMGEFYSALIQQKDFGERIIQALEIIAEPSNHPLIYHCSAGKDRTGILTIVLLGILDVMDEDIVADYCLSASHTEVLYNRMRRDPQLDPDAGGLPDYFWRVAPTTVNLFLTYIRSQYGSCTNYIREKGADYSLQNRLKQALLV